MIIKSIRVMNKSSNNSQNCTSFCAAHRSGLKLAHLQVLKESLNLFSPGQPLFWNHPFISAQMLAAHLNPDNDQASCRPETIDCSIHWLIPHLNFYCPCMCSIWAAGPDWILLAGLDGYLS